MAAVTPDSRSPQWTLGQSHNRGGTAAKAPAAKGMELFRIDVTSLADNSLMSGLRGIGRVAYSSVAAADATFECSALDLSSGQGSIIGTNVADTGTGDGAVYVWQKRGSTAGVAASGNNTTLALSAGTITAPTSRNAASRRARGGRSSFSQGVGWVGSVYMRFHFTDVDDTDTWSCGTHLGSGFLSDCAWESDTNASPCYPAAGASAITFNTGGASNIDGTLHCWYWARPRPVRP